MIWTGMTKYANMGLLILRLGIGVSFLIHGFLKFQGGADVLTRVGSAMSNFGIHGGHYALGLAAALGEMLGGLLFLFGAFFRPACLLLTSIMIVAVTSHVARGDGFHGYAHAMKMLILFVAMFFVGPGKFSVDRQ